MVNILCLVQDVTKVPPEPADVMPSFWMAVSAQTSQLLAVRIVPLCARCSRTSSESIYWYQVL